MKTKARRRITDNIVSETEQEASYQDHELVGLQEVLEVDPDVINESLVVNMKEKINNLFWYRGRGGGRRTFNYGRRRGVSLGVPITTNPSTSSNHISTSESMIHVVVLTPNTLPTAQDQPNPTFVRESIPTTPVGDASPLAPDDSLIHEYPNCEHIVDQRPLIRAYKGEFQPTYGCLNIILDIIRAKFDEPTPSWLKVSVDLSDRWFGEFKVI
ncbi:hypothetical protein JHK82_024707 [Glycine max]|nr:hypothetical protein JHK82_024707 [Glycine max]